MESDASKHVSYTVVKPTPPFIEVEAGNYRIEYLCARQRDSFLVLLINLEAATLITPDPRHGSGRGPLQLYNRAS